MSEHAQLVADLLSLEMIPKVEKLLRSKCYNIGNRYLPGNLTPYEGLKRLGGNTYLCFDGNACEIHRFYPLRPHPEFRSDEEKQKGIQRISELIHNEVLCCTKKWDNCALSLTGGTDSRTTLACARDLQSKLHCFTFHAKAQDLLDAEAAKKICEALGIAHTLYHIPEKNEEIEDFELFKNILQHNTSYTKNLADREVRKYAYLYKLNAYDVELKSFVTEIGRAFMERKYQIKMPEVLNERHLSIFQTRYFGHPRLLKWSDKMYRDFMRETGLDGSLFNFEHTDLYYWEVRLGSWGVGVTTSQQVYHRVTIPVNNRKILELFLSFPHEERVSDSVHRRVMAYSSPLVQNAEFDIPNLYFHAYRQIAEKLFFKLRTKFYRSR